jgi:cyanate permease
MLVSGIATAQGAGTRGTPRSIAKTVGLVVAASCGIMFVGALAGATGLFPVSLSMFAAFGLFVAFLLDRASNAPVGRPEKWGPPDPAETPDSLSPPTDVG